MLAIFFAPFYVLVNVYIVRWMILWMGACHRLFQTIYFRAAFIGIYIFLASTLLTGVLIKRPAALHHALKVIGNYFLGTFLYILLVILVVDLGRILLKYVFHASWIHYRSTFAITGLICTLLVAAISVFGILHAKNIKVTSYDITIHKKVENLDSLKILLAADTHFGYTVGRSQARQLVEKINEENPDLVCFAGDMFDNEFDAVRYPEDIKNSLKSIQAKYGVYACWGNHDVNEPILAGFTFSGNGEKEDPRMREFLEDAGVRLLEDESILIDNKFYLVGRKDIDRTEKMQEERLTPAQLTAGLDKSKPILFLDHQPKQLKEVADSGADLDLCGHTHNGQVFPGNLIIQLFWENPCGYLQKGNMHNIVTSGAGIWGPGMRVGTDSEICVINVHFQ